MHKCKNIIWKHKPKRTARSSPIEAERWYMLVLKLRCSSSPSC